MTPQLELKDVALPELVRLRAFEATHRMVPRFGRLRRRYKPRLAQDAVRRTRRDTQALKSSEHVADATRTPIGVRLLHREHRVALRLRLLAVLASVDLSLGWELPQRIHPASAKQRHELLNHR